MVRSHTYNQLTWVDVEAPTKQELAELAQTYQLHPLVVEALREPSERSRVETFAEHAYLILHFPAGEIDIVLGNNFIITTHYRTINALYEFAKLFDVTATLNKTDIGNHAGYLFFSLINHLYRDLESDISAVERELADIERRVLAGEEQRMVARLSHLSRKLLDIKRAVSSHRETWLSFLDASRTLFGEAYRHYASAIAGEHLRLWNRIENAREMLGDLRETNDSLLNARMSQTMVHLTMMAFVVFPLTLVASIFSMNTTSMPIVGLRNDFWIVVALMFGVAAAVIAFFKQRKWL